MSSLFQTQLSKNYKSSNKKTCYKLGTLSFQSHLKCYLEYLATNQVMITTLGFSDPYIRIKCHILIKVLQLFGTPSQQLLQTHEIFHIVLPTPAADIWLNVDISN